MKIVIIYFSEHHGNTKKLLDAIKELGEIKLINVVECPEIDLSDYDIIGFASGAYFGKFSETILNFTKNNLPSNKSVFLINTYGVKGNYTKEMEQIIREKECQLLGIYGCRGFDTFGPFKIIGGLAKDHPNEKDIKGVKDFMVKIIQE